MALAGAYLSGHGTSVPMNLTLLFGTEVPYFENNNPGFTEQNNRALANAADGEAGKDIVANMLWGLAVYNENVIA